MSEEEDDPELALALALSKGEVEVQPQEQGQQQAQQQEDEEDDPEALALALAMSREGGGEEKGSSFKLSAVLGPHTRGCRTAAIIDDDVFATSGEQGDFAVWKREPLKTPPSFSKRSPFGNDLQHGGLVFVLQAYGGLFASGGKDKTVQVWSEDGTVIKVLAGGHTNSIGAITTTSDGKLVTGAWDGTVLQWGTNNQVERRIADPRHQYAVEVAALTDGRLATASAKNIILFNADGSESKTIPQDMVRSVASLPDGGFVTSANDGHVKVWSNEGKCVKDMLAGALTYTVAVRKIGETTEIVCGGEDQILRVFDSSSGSLVQEVMFPGAIRCIRVFPNGDLLVCCSDRYAYIFTRSQLRIAGPQDAQRFQNYQASVATQTSASQTTGTVNPNKLPTQAELMATKGNKVGAISMTNEGGKSMAYSWTGSTWQLLGEVVGAEQPPPKEINVTVELGTRQFPLSFNRRDDPRQVANDFCVQHRLPGDMVGQVQQYVAQLQRS